MDRALTTSVAEEAECCVAPTATFMRVGTVAALSVFALIAGAVAGSHWSIKESSEVPQTESYTSAQISPIPSGNTRHPEKRFLNEINRLQAQNISLRAEVDAAQSETVRLNNELLQLELAKIAQISAPEPLSEPRVTYSQVDVPIGSSVEQGQQTLDPEGIRSDLTGETSVAEPMEGKVVVPENLSSSRGNSDTDTPVTWANNEPVKFIDAYPQE